MRPQPENWSACQAVTVRLRGNNRYGQVSHHDHDDDDDGEPIILLQGCFDESRRWLLSQNFSLMVGTGVAMAFQVYK